MGDGVCLCTGHSRRCIEDGFPAGRRTRARQPDARAVVTGCDERGGVTASAQVTTGLEEGVVGPEGSRKLETQKILILFTNIV